MSRPRFLTLAVTLVALACVRTAVAGSCEEVWFVEGNFVGETFTCGERIVFLQTPQGGLLTEQEARVQAALEELKCADCWPWEKYRQDGETERSSKRGIAIENSLLTAEALSGLSQIISWGATWEHNITDGPDLSVWKMAGVDFVPMIWGAGTIPLAEASGLPSSSSALLGFNEPNFPNQADLDPSAAAEHWKDVEQLAADYGISTIVSPSMNYHWSMDPIDWLQQFFAHCEGCKVDAIGIHVFTCYAAGLKYHLDRYRIFGKPMWITEIACSDPASPERLSAEGQMAYMREAIPLLEADEDVAKYAWFSYFKDEWAHPIVDGENGDAGLVHPNGTLTPLGNLYNSFAAGSNLTEINITEPENETISSTTSSKTWTTSLAWTQTFTTTLSGTTRSETITTLTGTLTSQSLTTTLTGTMASKTRTLTTLTTSMSESTETLSATSTGSMTSETFSETLSTTLSGTSTGTMTSETFTATSSRTRSVTPTSTLRGTTRSETATTGTTITTTSGNKAAVTGSSTSETLSTTATDTRTSRTVTGTGTRTTAQGSILGTITASSTTRLSGSSTPIKSTTWSSTSTDVIEDPSTTSEMPTTTAPKGKVTTATRSLTATAPSTTVPEGGESTTGEELEENATNESVIEGLSCTEAMDAWCHSDPSSAPFFPLHHCADWRLHDAMCSTGGTGDSSGVNSGPQFAGITELDEGSRFPAAFLLVAVVGAAMAGAALASLFHRHKCSNLPLCGCFRKKQEQEQEIQKTISRKSDWVPGSCLPLGNGANSRVAPEPGFPNLLLPMEAVARRAASSPHASDLCEGSPVIGICSKKGRAPDVAVGTPVGTTPASRAAVLARLTDAISKTTSDDIALEEREASIQEAGRILTGKAILNLPLALRQEVEVWHSRQQERLRLAKSMEAAVNRATSLEAEAPPVDALGILLSRAKLAGSGDHEALLAEAARRASAFQEELDRQRLKLQTRRKVDEGHQPLLAMADLMQQRDDLAELHRKAEAELCSLQALWNIRGGKDWDGACGMLEDVWNEFRADAGTAAEEVQAALAETNATHTMKVFSSDLERQAALAEAARRQAAFQEELQKQRQKLQKRSKVKSAPVELGRLLEDEATAQALKLDREAAMAECREFLASGADSDKWEELLKGWEAMKEDIAEVSNQDFEAKEKASVWASAAKMEDVNHDEQLALLEEAARRVAVFDEELQKQRQQMKKRRKVLQKQGGPEQVPDPLDACRTMADQEVLTKLTREQAEAQAQCQAMAAGNGMLDAWEQLGSAWAQMQKDIAKAEKEVSESAQLVAMSDTTCLVRALGLLGDSEDGAASRRAALQEAARRIAVFDEELAKQRAAMRRERDRPQQKGAFALGAALLQGEALKALAVESAAAKAACEAAKEDCEAEAWQAWQDLQKIWGSLQADLAEATRETAETASAAQKASEALCAHELTTAARRVVAFEHQLGQLTGVHDAASSGVEVRRARNCALVQRLQSELAEGLAFCRAKAAAAGSQEATPIMSECCDAWQELLDLWCELAKELDLIAQELATPQPLASTHGLRKILETSVSDAERQSALAEAARCAAQFDEELQQQRQRLVRRKKAEHTGHRLLALGDAMELQALAKEQAAAKSACHKAMKKAEAANACDEAQGWKQIMDTYVALKHDLDLARKEADASGSLVAEPNAAGRQAIHEVIRDQKKSAAGCLKAVECALSTDRGPLQLLVEAQQAVRSVKSGGGSTHRARRAEAAAQVQTWDVLEEAQGLLESLNTESASDPTKEVQSLKRLGVEASKQLRDLSASHTEETLENVIKVQSRQEVPMKQDFGCQTSFRLGGMAWHANPVVQKLLEDLSKVSSGPSLKGQPLEELDDEVTEILKQWRKDFIKRQEVPVAPPPQPLQPHDAHHAQLVPAEPAVSQLLEADLVASAAKKKVDSSSSIPPSWSIQRAEVKVETGSISVQSSKFDHPSLKSGEAQTDKDDLTSTVPETMVSNDRMSSRNGQLSSRRLANSESRRLSVSLSSDNLVTAKKASSSTSPPRRRRSESRDGPGTASVDSSLMPGQPIEITPVLKESTAREAGETRSSRLIMEDEDLLERLEKIKQSGHQVHAYSEHVDNQAQNSGLPSSSEHVGKRGGPGDGSLLVPPPSGEVSRSLSPASSGRSQSPGHMPRRLDPIVRPRGPPLPSAGRLLLASQQEAESMKSSPRSFC